MLVHLYESRETDLYARPLPNPKVAREIPASLYARYEAALAEWERVQELLWEQVSEEAQNAQR